ncbi:MAG: peptidoglycan recognition protein family protein [Culicoidibacterales bacterium]
MKKRQNLVPQSRYSIKCPYTMQAEYITVHNTANDASAWNETANVNRAENTQEVSFHWAVDDIEAVQLVHTNRNAWACGDGANGTGNRKSISVEICYSKSGGPKFDQAEKNAALLIAELMKEHGFGIDRVKRHYDWSKKDCPKRTMANGWQRFLNMVQAEYNNLAKPVQPTQPKYVREFPQTGEFYITTGKARYICDVPSLNSKDLGTVAPATWTAYDYVVYNDGRIWCQTKKGWVSTGSYDKDTLKRTEVFANFR